MDKYHLFQGCIDKAVNVFDSWDKDKTISLISHLDADGITACAILTRLLNLENRRYTISILPQLTKEHILDLAKEEDNYIIFADLGSGQISMINQYLKQKDIIILDHHEIENKEISKNICHINPHMFEIDGSKEISGSGVCYLFSKAINKDLESLAHLAIIGAIGDIQEEKGFKHLNKEILDTAIRTGNLNMKKGLRFFGTQTRPIHKVLEYSTDPLIPGVSGSESKAIQFLYQIGIDPKDNKRWKTISQLDQEEMQKLVAGVIMKRSQEKDPQDVLGNIYTLPSEDNGTPTKDAREFATLLNACGRMDKASHGIGACLGSKEDKRKALQTLADYKKEIVKAINWYKENQDTKNIIKGKNYIIINAKDNIKHTVIGTLASIVSKSNFVKDNTFVLSLAKADNKTIKSSLRINSSSTDIDLREIIRNISLPIQGEAGGHIMAAGAIFDITKEKEFIDSAIKNLENTRLS